MHIHDIVNFLDFQLVFNQYFFSNTFGWNVQKKLKGPSVKELLTPQFKQKKKKDRNSVNIGY